MKYLKRLSWLMVLFTHSQTIFSARVYEVQKQPEKQLSYYIYTATMQVGKSIQVPGYRDIYKVRSDIAKNTSGIKKNITDLCVYADDKNIVYVCAYCFQPSQSGPFQKTSSGLKTVEQQKIAYEQDVMNSISKWPNALRISYANS